MDGFVLEEKSKILGLSLADCVGALTLYLTLTVGPSFAVSLEPLGHH